MMRPCKSKKATVAGMRGEMLRSEGRFLYPLFPYTIELRMLHPNAPMATKLGDDLDRVFEFIKRRKLGSQ
jgi:hypothetical protein